MSCGCFDTHKKKVRQQESVRYVAVSQSYKSGKYKQELKKRIMNKPEAYEIYG